jgi:hypothetical protein
MVWLLLLLAWIVFVSVYGYRQVMKTTRAEAELKLVPWTGRLERGPGLAKAVAGLEAVGFEVLEELAATNASSASNQDTVVRVVAMRDRDGRTWAAPFEMTTLLPQEGNAPEIGQQRTTTDLFSMLESERTINTSNVELGYFDPNPKHSMKKLPLVGSIAELVEIHRNDLAKESATSPVVDLRTLDFQTQYKKSWLENYEF